MGPIATELTWHWWRVKFAFQDRIGRHIGYPPPWSQVVVHVLRDIYRIADHIGRHHDPEAAVRMYDVCVGWLENFETEAPDQDDVMWLVNTTRDIAIEACRVDHAA